LGRLWIFFLGGAGEGTRNSRTRTTESFSQDDTSLQTALFMLYIIVYIEQWGFSLQHATDNHERYPRSSRPWTDTSSVQASTTRRPVPQIEDSVTWGCFTSFHHGLHGAVGMVFYADAVYVTYYFCYMFSLGPSSGNSGSVRIYRRVIFFKQNWWCARTSCT
jgi:hypothetical protein